MNFITNLILTAPEILQILGDNVLPSTLPTTFKLENVVTGHQSMGLITQPDISTALRILLCWIPVLEQWSKERRHRKQTLIKLPAAT